MTWGQHRVWRVRYRRDGHQAQVRHFFDATAARRLLERLAGPTPDGLAPVVFHVLDERADVAPWAVVDEVES